MEFVERVGRWRAFARDCLDGYAWDLEDYLVEVNARSVLHEVITNSAAAGPADRRRTVAELEEIDARLRPVFGIEAFPRLPEEEWWLRRVPSYAARDICREFQETYGLSVAARSKFDVDVDEMTRLFAEGMPPADLCLKVAGEEWYVAEQPGLLYRACRRAFPVDRRARRAIWAWATGEAPESALRAALSESAGG
ncbi:hypothetical protein [Streptomyces sp. MST-110588]|uniref:hypothetical protein n=1 Tax=Streptomyces sp. MST-110588 TaxID=2833628 RepID=UPI001F5DA8E5|nr:hypothetical protein [Streptomyces sp. MST-110588]UNO40247.1 hypothetical protein KGS77_12485 [Streptomyces sp. MST-110588]